MVPVLVVGVATVAVSSFAFLALARVLFNRSYSASWLLKKASVRCFFMSCMLVELYARGLSCEDIAEVGRRIYTVTTTANSR